MFEKPEFSGRDARIYETLTKNTIPEILLYFIYFIYIFLCVDPWNREKEKKILKEKEEEDTQQVLLPSPVSTFITQKIKKEEEICLSLSTRG